MPLTKVAPPVTNISQMAFGTTVINIPSAGADIDIDVAGTDVADISDTGLVVDDAIEVTARDILGELITLATSGGAGALLRTTASLMEFITTTAHPAVFGANNNQNLIAEIDGTVTLDTSGSAVDSLIDKAYADAIAAAAPTLNDMDATAADPGHITFPNSTGNDLIFNWGTNPSVLNNSQTVVTFEQAYSSAFLIGLVTPTTSDNHDGTMEVFANSLTTMTIHSSLDHSSAFAWFSIGF